MQGFEKQDTSFEYLLGVVVPVTKMAGKLQNLKGWLDKSPEYSISVCLVHDIKDSETGLELAELVNQINSKSIVLVEGEYGNPGAARNKGLESINSKWIAFWDSDDMPNLEVAFSGLETASQDCQLLVFDFETKNDVTGETRPNYLEFLEGRDLIREIASHPGLWRFIFSSDLLKEVSFPHLTMAEDQIFLSRLEPETKRICHIPEVEYTYTIFREGQLTLNKLAIQDLKHSIKELLTKDKLMSEFNMVILIRQILTLVKRGTFKSRIYLLRAVYRIMINSDFQSKIKILSNLSFVLKRIEF